MFSMDSSTHNFWTLFMKSEVKFSTLGCRLNSYETEAMRHLADTAGINEAVVINTLSLIHI